jgi:DNA-binding NtrC family response regulator
MGQNSASHLELGGGYRYQGIPGWTPEQAGQWNQPIPNRGGARRSEDRIARQALYDKLRRQGVEPAEAAEEVGITRKTRYRYEREYLGSLSDGGTS